jgi:hypothetical protein
MEGIVIDQAGFDQIPAWAIAFAASAFAVLFLKSLGGKAKSEEGGFWNVVVDVLELVTAASVVASISAIPFVSYWLNEVQTGILSWFGNDAASAVVGTFLGLFTLFVGYQYIQSSNWLWLIGFGIILMVDAGIVPQISMVLSWWINGPIQAGWNGFWGLVGAVANYQPGG